MLLTYAIGHAEDLIRDSANLLIAVLAGVSLCGVEMMGANLCNTAMPDGSVIYRGCAAISNLWVPTTLEIVKTAAEE